MARFKKVSCFFQGRLTKRESLEKREKIGVTHGLARREECLSKMMGGVKVKGRKPLAPGSANVRTTSIHRKGGDG